MRITGRMEKTGDKIYFLGRVFERTARGYPVEANPKYIRNVINVLGLEEAKPVMTPSVKRTPTTESLVELEGERRAMYRTVVGKLLYMCQERADVMCSVKETARKITCPTESDEMNLKRVVRYLKSAPSAKSLIDRKVDNACLKSGRCRTGIVSEPTVFERIHQLFLHARISSRVMWCVWSSSANLSISRHISSVRPVSNMFLRNFSPRMNRSWMPK